MTAAQMLQTTPASSALRRERPATNSVSARDILNSLFYYRKAALLIALTIIALGVLAALLIPPVYKAEARLLTLNAGYYDIRSDRQDAGQSQATLPDEVVNVEMQLLSSAELHRQVAKEDLGASASTDAVDRRVTDIERNLHIAKVEASNVLSLTYTDRDPVKASDMLRHLLTVYFRERGGVLTSGRVAFLTTQRDKLKDQLDQADAQITGYQSRYNVLDIGAQINAAVTTDAQLRQQRLDAEAGLAQANGSLAKLRSDSAAVPRQVELYSDDSEAARTIGQMQANLLQLQARRAELASRYMAGSPLVAQADQQIARLQQTINSTRTGPMVSRRVGYNSYYDQVHDRILQANAQVASQTARRTTLDRQIGSSAGRLRELIGVSDTLSRLRVQRDILADGYKRFANQVEQARIQQNEATSTGSTNVRVIQQPVPPTERSNPPLIFIAAAVLIGIAAAAAAVFFMSSVRETFLSPQEAERTLRLPVLSAPLEGDFDPDHRDYGRMIAAIDNSSTSRTKVALLVSPRADDAEEGLAEGLYRALERRAPGRVAAIDAETARAELGDGWINSSFDRLIGELRKQFTYILLMAPPMAGSFEAVEMASRADAILVLVRAEVTRKPVAEDVITKLTASGAPVSGLVMTGRRRYIPQFIYRMI